MISFADLSHHQDQVDLAAYAAAGHDRIALKATESTNFVDPAFAARWRQAGALGLARVAYHFARNGTSGANQLDSCLSVVAAAGGLGPRDRLCLDTEDPTSPGRARACAVEFCDQASARGAPAGLIYSYRSYLADAGIGPADLPPGWRQLWLANYATDNPQLPPGWTQMSAQQFTDRAAVPGVAGGCDYSHVIHDWLTEDDMLTPDDVRAAVRDVLGFSPGANLQRPRGQADGNEDMYATLLGMDQAEVNRDNMTAARLAQLLSNDVAIEAAVAKVVAAAGPGADPAAVAHATVAELRDALGRGEPA